MQRLILPGPLANNPAKKPSLPPRAPQVIKRRNYIIDKGLALCLNPHTEARSPSEVNLRKNPALNWKRTWLSFDRMSAGW